MGLGLKKIIKKGLHIGAGSTPEGLLMKGTYDLRKKAEKDVDKGTTYAPLPDSKFAAQKALARQGADIQRQYAETFLDTERGIRATATGTNGQQVQTDIGTAMTSAGRDVDNAQATLARQAQATGGTVSSSNTRKVGLARALAQVDAGNRAGDSAEAKQRAAQQFGMQQWGADSTNAVNTLAGIAASEEDRYQQYKAAKQKYKSGLLGGIGSVVGGVIGGIYGGPSGAMGGAKAGGSIGSSISG